MNWAVTLGYVTTGDVGVLAFLLYAGMQFAGAATAGMCNSLFLQILLFPAKRAYNIALSNLHTHLGAILGALGTAAIPNYTGTAITGTTAPVATTPISSIAAWGLEFFASLFVTFMVIFNEKMELHNEDEDKNHFRVGSITALAIFAIVLTFFGNGIYSFNNVVYFAGLVGVGATTTLGAEGRTSNLVATGLVDYAHYLGTPIAGAIGAAALYWILRLLLVYFPKSKAHKASTNNDGDNNAIESQFGYDATSPLLQPENLVHRNVNTAQGIKVNAFKHE